MSPCKQTPGSVNFVTKGHHHRGYFDEDDDSGADSLNDQVTPQSDTWVW